MALVEIEAGPFLITAAITRDAVEELGLAPGVEATATVKATSVMVARGAGQAADQMPPAREWAALNGLRLANRRSGRSGSAMLAPAFRRGPAARAAGQSARRIAFRRRSILGPELLGAVLEALDRGRR